MAISLRRRTIGGISLLAVGVAVLVVGLVLGFQDAADRNFGSPKVFRESAQTTEGVRDEQVFLVQRPWPLFWKTTVGYGFRYLHGTEDGVTVWIVKEGVVLQEWPGTQTVQRIVCTSTGYRVGVTDVLEGVDCACWGGEDCDVPDLEYLVRVRTDMKATRSYPRVPFITRRMAH
ncbi:MAG: hypothetical protein IT405_02815 [Candidatus Yanofskybacteria bacterium]|nr:hypothetical protein [Candidatus Yanofskybacteria bacterium]